VLAEVQQLCHSVSIIGAGRLIASGSVAELVGDSTLAVARVWVADSSAAIRLLVGARYRVVRNGDHLDVE
jgi:ABC-2 type transport system ATP-binding protein